MCAVPPTAGRISIQQIQSRIQQTQRNIVEHTANKLPESLSRRTDTTSGIDTIVPYIEVAHTAQLVSILFEQSQLKRHTL